MSKNNVDILSILEEHGAFITGHFRLISGRHSGLYIQAASVMGHPHIAQKVAAMMSAKFNKPADAVLAPGAEAAVIAQEVARARGVRSMFAEKAGGMLVLKRNFIIKPGERILIVDDVAVSGKKILQAAALVKQCGGKVVGVAVIVDRSSGDLGLTVPLRPLLSYPMKEYEEHECPLCERKIPLTDKGE